MGKRTTNRPVNVPFAPVLLNVPVDRTSSSEKPARVGMISKLSPASNRQLNDPGDIFLTSPKHTCQRREEQREVGCKSFGGQRSRGSRLTWGSESQPKDLRRLCYHSKEKQPGVQNSEGHPPLLRSVPQSAAGGHLRLCSPLHLPHAMCRLVLTDAALGPQRGGVWAGRG